LFLVLVLAGAKREALWFPGFLPREPIWLFVVGPFTLRSSINPLTKVFKPF
jgi:hypothetical protein